MRRYRQCVYGLLCWEWVSRAPPGPPPASFCDTGISFVRSGTWYQVRFQHVIPRISICTDTNPVHFAKTICTTYDTTVLLIVVVLLPLPLLHYHTTSTNTVVAVLVNLLLASSPQHIYFVPGILHTFAEERSRRGPFRCDARANADSGEPHKKKKL